VQFKPGQMLKIVGAEGSGEWGVFIVLENMPDNGIKLWTVSAPKAWSNTLSRQTFIFEPQLWLDRHGGEYIEILSEETASLNEAPKGKQRNEV